MTLVRVADFIADWLSKELSASKIFMVTGAGVMHLTDGVAKHESLEAICLHHEQSVSMAVEAYSRYTESIGIAYVSTGPAATNALTGLAGAWQDSVACFFFSGQVKVAESSSQSGISGLRQFGVQELDVLPMTRPVTKYSAQVTKAENILQELEKAKKFALQGRPGPVWLEIPLDVQSALVEPSQLEHYQKSQVTEPEFVAEPLPQKLVKGLDNSARPVIVLGQGVRLSGAMEELQTFVRRHRIPVVSTYLGVDSYLPHDELYVGKIGVKGERAANIMVQKSDFLLVLGASLHVSSIGYNYSEFASDAEKWIVDIDETSHRKPTLTTANFFRSDLRDFIPRLMDFFEGRDEQRDWASWSNVGAQLRAKYPTCLKEYEGEEEGVNIYTAVDIISEYLGPDDVVVSDAGSAFYAVTQAVVLPRSGRYITSGAMATMGYSLPAAIGIAVASPAGRVFAFTGDGSLHQNIQELGQMQFLGLPIVLIVLNNAGYLSIRASQINYFEERFIGTDEKSGLGLPDITQISRAYGLRVLDIGSVEELKSALQEIGSIREPVVLNIKCPENQPIVPTVSSRIDDEGKMHSRNLHDMTPLVDEVTLREIMSPDWGMPGPAS